MTQYLEPEHSTKLMDLESISKHNKEDDGWIIINSGVYDVSKFIKFHPGGKDIITRNLGTDLTEAFQSESIHSHSEKAWKLLEQYKIGDLNNPKLQKTQSCSDEDDKLSNLINMENPVVNQVYNMNPKLYHQWLHTFPTAITMKLFETKFLELCSRYPWYYILPLWIPVVLYNIIVCFNEGSGILGLLYAYSGGILFWTLLEYTLHRFLFHIETDTALGNFYHFMAHGIHHLSPLDPTRLTFPPVFSVFIVTFLYKLMSNFGIPNYNGFFAGGLTGYLLYDTMHYFFHHGSLCEKVPYLKWMRTRHFRHHYVSDDKNFGVSSPLWDIVFGTCDI